MIRNAPRLGRFLGVLVALAGLLAILAPWITAKLGLTPRFEMLMYLAAMGAFVWAMVVSLRMWRSRD